MRRSRRRLFYPVYLIYANDAIDVWLEQSLGSDYLTRFQYQTKKASIEWSGSARLQEVVEIRP